MAYIHSAPFYDLFTSQDDISYYKELGLQYANALEIGVGTARVAIELAKEGVEVYGIDNSSPMLEKAREKLALEPVEVRKRLKLFNADMIDFNLNRTFSLVYIPSSTIQYCTTQEQQLSCLKTVKRHLSKNGLLAFNLILPSAKYNPNLQLIGKAQLDGATILRFISYRPNWQEKNLEVILLFELYKNGVMTKRFYDLSTLAMISKREILLLLKKTKFKVENIYGNYKKSRKIVNQAIIEARSFQ